ncbi:MAG: sugar ABC transporter substrate-binding protein [Phototrophicales bacterium]|nr:MAG: sugar ABC transporter substrate-binding protein [Phototrophicales bacterium]
MLKKTKIVLVTMVAVASLLLASATKTPQTQTVEAQEPVVITWFVGLGAGGDPPQIEAQNKVVADFNETHDDIQLEIVIAENNVAYDTLNTLLNSPNPPDIVGPVGIRGANAFDGNFADLEPLIEAAGYDLSQFPESLVDFYRVEGQGLIGLPFGQFPSMIFFNRDLFDAAGIPYPPQEYGAPYADGEEWNFDKLREVAMLLTLDANGNNAFSPDFDPENIVQFGFVNQFTDFRGAATSFGAGSFVDENGNAVMPPQWEEYTYWLYDAMWVDHFIPTANYEASDLLANGNPFASGNVAMAMTHLWYTCCLGEVSNWDLAVHPSYNGVVTAKLHADTFRILKASQHPEEAFEVLAYLLGPASDELLAVYGGVPARPEAQDAFFATLDERYPQGVNWQVAIDSLAYPDNPNHESNMPNFQKADERIKAFGSLLSSDGDLDLEEAINTLISDLQAIFDEAKAESE